MFYPWLIGLNASPSAGCGVGIFEGGYPFIDGATRRAGARISGRLGEGLHVVPVAAIDDFGFDPAEHARFAP